MFDVGGDSGALLAEAACESTEGFESAGVSQVAPGEQSPLGPPFPLVVVNGSKLFPELVGGGDGLVGVPQGLEPFLA